MSQLSRTEWEALYGTTGTVFPDNTTGEISEGDMRTFGKNASDSIPFTRNDSYTWAFPKADTSGTNTYAVTLSPAITAYTNGMKIHVKIKTASTGASTLNANTVGARKIFLDPTTQADSGDLIDEQEYIMSYDSALDAAVGGWLIIGGGGSGGGAVDSVNGQTGVVQINADDVPFTPAGNIAATDVQAAIEELDSEKLSSAGSKVLVIAASDEITPITASAGKVTFRMPYAMTLSAVRASLTTAQTSGSTFTVDIHETGTTILSTKITIDNGEKTSTTAATPPVISDTSLADDAEITIDVDQQGDNTAKGLKVYLIGS